MKYIKLYENFEGINQICKKYGIKNYTINDDGSIDVDGDVDLYDKKLTKLPLKFSRIDYNDIRDFEFFPKYIGGNFYCNYNPVYEVWRLFEDLSKIELLNFYDAIRGDSIVIDRLNEFLKEIGKNPVENIPGYKNI